MPRMVLAGVERDVPPDRVDEAKARGAMIVEAKPLGMGDMPLMPLMPGGPRVRDASWAVPIAAGAAGFAAGGPLGAGVGVGGGELLRQKMMGEQIEPGIAAVDAALGTATAGAPGALRAAGRIPIVRGAAKAGAKWATRQIPGSGKVIDLLDNLLQPKASPAAAPPRHPPVAAPRYPPVAAPRHPPVAPPAQPVAAPVKAAPKAKPARQSAAPKPKRAQSTKPAQSAAPKAKPAQTVKPKATRAPKATSSPSMAQRAARPANTKPPEPVAGERYTRTLSPLAERKMAEQEARLLAGSGAGASPEQYAALLARKQPGLSSRKLAARRTPTIDAHLAGKPSPQSVVRGADDDFAAQMREMEMLGAELEAQGFTPHQRLKILSQYGTELRERAAGH